jgi:hypothetical protein
MNYTLCSREPAPQEFWRSSCIAGSKKVNRLVVESVSCTAKGDFGNGRARTRGVSVLLLTLICGLLLTVQNASAFQAGDRIRATDDINVRTAPPDLTAIARTSSSGIGEI